MRWCRSRVGLEQGVEVRGVSMDTEWRGKGDIIRNRVTGNGKGDKQRPGSVTRDEFASNWERTFGQKKPDESGTK
jgi:hypothetical protein